ncbi:PREDICTED: protein IQ-DOMAIN 31-like [Camelina sativa]|uniref:Protein IQ-DOMAIN 31-like n=1 Tax=Camelina sativa TaxID=90675 RepID=A0ABM0VQ60_CAMSA|nr:PREDICTED: protein IQ-DOMAIN 31-like [Camelina sativa]XP_010459531.1 PREDICTED: protein IQ-DOMAIN 31-like [Camelina sativa]XP_019091737.1 PREDICTED: protein IQ-DOMAIN 31-like [Camelina sativa]
MGKPVRWLKNVLLGKKPSKSSGIKEKERTVNGKEVVVISKVEESDVFSDLPPIGNAAVYTSGMVETQNLEHEDVSANEIQVSEVQPTDSQDAAFVPDDSPSESEKIQQETAAVTVQAAYRGYLARRAFRILKGIIRLQAVFRGHMVRRQAVSTLCCVMGIVRLQALARGRETRHSDIGVEVHRKCWLHHQPLENKLTDSVVDTHAYLGIKKLTANAFAQKLLASSPNVMPLSLENDSSNSIWLENWSASCFWKPVPQPKKASVRKTQKKLGSNSQVVEAEFARPKKSVRKVPTSNLDNPSVAAQTSLEFEKPKRSFRKVSASQSVEPLPDMENPQVDLEKVKRGLRKVHNPIVENSIQPQQVPQIAVEKPNPGLEEEFVNEDERSETVVEQPEDIMQTHGPLRASEALDSKLVNQIEESEENVMMAEEKEYVKEERTPKQNYKENSARKENQKSGKKGPLVTAAQTAECQESSYANQTSNPGIPSYMQATKSAKAKLRLQGSSSPKELGTTEKASRRYSLPSSGNSARVTSHSPKTRVSNSGGKTGNKTAKPLLTSREGNGKKTPVEWKRW